MFSGGIVLTRFAATGRPPAEDKVRIGNCFGWRFCLLPVQQAPEYGDEARTSPNFIMLYCCRDLSCAYYRAYVAHDPIPPGPTSKARLLLGRKSGGAENGSVETFSPGASRKSTLFILSWTVAAV